jgi:hypothetical protein
MLFEAHLTRERMEDDVHAHYDTRTRKCTGSVLYESGFCRNQAYRGICGSSEPRSISLSEFAGLYHVLLPQPAILILTDFYGGCDGG